MSRSRSRSSCMNFNSASASNTTKLSAEVISAYKELSGLLPELSIKTSDNSPDLKKCVRDDQTILLLIKEGIANAIATITFLASLDTALSEGDKLTDFSVTLQALSPELASLCSRRLRSKKEEIRQKTRLTEWWRKLCKVMCNVIFVSVGVGSVALSAITAPHFAVLAAVTGGSLIKAAEQWSDSVWDGVLSELEEEKKVVKVLMKMEVGVHEMELSLSAIVKKLETTVEANVGNVAVEGPRGMEMVMEEMKRRAEEGVNLIKEVKEKVKACEIEIKKGVTQLMEVITE